MKVVSYRVLDDNTSYIDSMIIEMIVQNVHLWLLRIERKVEKCCNK